MNKNLEHLTDLQRSALDECVAFLQSQYEVLAIVACGTIVRGTGDPRSDFDMQVVHREPYRHYFRRFFRGVPFEVFVNPPTSIESNLVNERPSRRPLTAHMLATGVVLFDTDGIGKGLIEKATEVLQNPPLPDANQVGFIKYIAASLLEDALDLSERDPQSAALVLGDVVWELVRARLLSEEGWFPRQKDALNRLREIDPESAALAEKASSSAPFIEKLEAGRLLCLRVTGYEGFFEWASEPEVL